MTDPLALLPLAIAAGGGVIDGMPARQWVAAGITLLQRSAALVRALAGRRSAILLPTGAHYLTALGASEGRSALLLDADGDDDALRAQLAAADVGAVFTTEPLRARLPEILSVTLDHAPRRARLWTAGGERDVDLGSHFALELHGDPEAPGSDEEVIACAQAGKSAAPVALTHGAVLGRARAIVRTLALGAHERVLAAAPFSNVEALQLGGLAPLLCGATVWPVPAFDADEVLASLRDRAVTTLIATPEQVTSLLTVRAGHSRLGALRRCCMPASPDTRGDLVAAWESATGVPLTVV